MQSEENSLNFFFLTEDFTKTRVFWAKDISKLPGELAYGILNYDMVNF